jgi:phosphoglycerate dehydrogenase-like enzyme
VIQVALMGGLQISAEELIRPDGVEVRFLPVPDLEDDVTVRDVLSRAEAVVGALPARSVPMPRVRMVHAVGAGVDHYAADALPKGAFLCNVYEHDQGIAEHVVMMLLALRRDLLGLDRRMRVGDWSRERFRHDGMVDELSGCTMGVLGLGHIGKALVPFARVLGMDVVGMRSRRPDGPPPEGVRAVVGPEGLDELLSVSDVLVSTLPLTGTTEGLIGARELSLLPRGAILINVGRGAVVDQWALHAALTSGHLSGAGLDVWYRYPDGSGAPCLPADAPLHELDNVLLTPHMSGWTDRTARGRWAFIGRNIARIARGERPENVVRTG